MADQSPAPLFFYQRDIIGNHETWRRLGMSASTEIGFQWWKLALNWQYIAGWWFQTFFIFHFIYGMSSFPLTFIFFKMVQTTNQIGNFSSQIWGFHWDMKIFHHDAWVKGLTPSSNWASLVGDSHHLPTRCPIAKLVYTLSFPQWYPLVMSK